MDFTTSKAATTGGTPDEARIAAAIGSLLSEYGALEGRMTLPAQGRRAFTMERLAAACFAAVDEYLDPYGLDCLDERAAEEVLRWSQFVTDLMVTAMLDYRERAERAGLRPEDCRDSLRRTLLDIWSISLEELEKSVDDDDDQDDMDAEDAA